MTSRFPLRLGARADRKAPNRVSGKPGAADARFGDVARSQAKRRGRSVMSTSGASGMSSPVGGRVDAGRLFASLIVLLVVAGLAVLAEPASAAPRERSTHRGAAAGDASGVRARHDGGGHARRRRARVRVRGEQELRLVCVHGGLQADLLVAVDAAGDMDAGVELFERRRSQLTPVSCQVTDRRGEATVDADATAGTSYLVRVGALANSVADRFTLRVVLPDEPATPPGQRLPRGAARGQVDRFANPDDAWSTPDAGGPHVPDQPRHGRLGLRAGRALRGRQLRQPGRADARLRRLHRLHRAALGPLHAARARSARLARAAAIPAACRPSGARRQRAGRRACRRPARRGHPGRRRARCPRPVPPHARAPQRPAGPAAQLAKLRPAAARRRWSPTRLQLRLCGQQGPHTPPAAGPVLHRGASPRTMAATSCHAWRASSRTPRCSPMADAAPPRRPGRP